MKKVFKIFITLFALIILIGYVNLNLNSNSVYYAKHMLRGEGQQPELIMLIDNLYWVQNPEIDGIKYDFDGTNVISFNNKQFFGNVYSDEVEYSYRNQNEIFYRFNKKFELLHVTDANNWEGIALNSVDYSEVISEIKELLAPIIDEQPEPSINLQWLFNLIYEDDFK